MAANGHQPFGQQQFTGKAVRPAIQVVLADAAQRSARDRRVILVDFLQVGQVRNRKEGGGWIFDERGLDFFEGCFQVSDGYGFSSVEELVCPRLDVVSQDGFEVIERGIDAPFFPAVLAK